MQITGSNRLWEVLKRLCVDRRLGLREMMLGVNSARVLNNVLIDPSTCHAVAHLDLSKNNLGDKGLELLAPALRTNCSLVCLKMGSNEISGTGMGQFFEALAENKSLDEIVITTEGGIARNRMTTKRSLKALHNFLI